jgi:hypothetical protein
MITYREELEKLDSYIENNKLKHSILSIMIYKFLFWIKIKLKKKDGYIDFYNMNSHMNLYFLNNKGDFKNGL